MWNFLKKSIIQLPFGPVIPLLGIYPKNHETPIIKNICTSIYVHKSVIYNSQDQEIAQVPISRWVDKKAVVHLHHGLLCGCKKRMKYFVTKWMDMELIMLLKLGSQSKTNRI